MLITERIANLIEEMLDRQDGICELRRNELANLIGCVPSQINYVITSRFTKERGYIVESRRGGGGYIKIIRPKMDGSLYMCHVLGAIGNSIDAESVVYIIKDMYSKDIISAREARILSSVLKNNVFSEVPKGYDDFMRAEIFKSALLSIMQD